MPSPRFPAAATLLDRKVCPLDRFDALFAKITHERRISDGYFLQGHPDEATTLFVVNGSPFGAGRLAGQDFAPLEVHEFFDAYFRHPESPLSFFVADKRLLLGLMVLFRRRPARQSTTDLLAMEEILEHLTSHSGNAILGIGSESQWAIGIVSGGRPVASYLPPSGTAALREPTPADRLLAYVHTRPPGEVTVKVFEETRVAPAGDAILVTPETRERLSQVFLDVAAKAREAEPASRPEAEAVPEPEVIPPPQPPAETEPWPEPTVAPAAATWPEAVAAPEPVLFVEGEESIMSPSVAAPPEAPVSLPEAASPEAPPVPVPEPEPTPRPVAEAPIPEIQLLIGDKSLGSYSLAKGELTIGRNQGNDILIDNAGVSRRHAVIRWSGEGATIQDLGSANGTYVGGKRVQSHELRDGDEVMIVKHRLIFRLPKEGEAPKVAAAAAAGQKTMFIDSAAIAQAMAGKASPRGEAATPVLRPRLILPDLKKIALESEEITLGSGSDCQIRLSGMFVAKLHARIIPQKEGQYRIVHVAGLAATRVNGEKITEHVLKHGDEIEIGKSRLLFRLER